MAETQAGAVRRRVLIAEDEALIRLDLAEMLVEEGYDVVGEAGDGETALHPSCTCKMGIDEMSVVDPMDMKVHDLEGLRVVDASVLPYITNGNIYAPIMMVAEKAADLILGTTPLPPATVKFYRHRPADRR